jgi:hypothetical protein
LNAELKTKIVTPMVFDWNLLARAEAFCELARRIGVELRVDPDGKLIASDGENARKYLADIANQHRAEIVAHLSGLPEPVIETEEEVEREAESFIIMAQALDAAIVDYCRATHQTDEHRAKLLAVRRRMAPYLLVQNLCAFRCWLHEARTSSKGL